jgi:hypothetical protein
MAISIANRLPEPVFFCPLFEPDYVRRLHC